MVRLIDAELLKENLEKLYDRTPADELTPELIREVIDNTPTADAITEEHDAKGKKYGSDLAEAYAERKHDEKYLKELNERHKKVFGKTLEESEKEGAE